MAPKRIKAHVAKKDCRFCEKKPATQGGFLCDDCRRELYEFLSLEKKKPENLLIEFYSEWR